MLAEPVVVIIMVNQTIILYTLNLYRDVGQLFLKTLEKNIQPYGQSPGKG